MSKAVLISIRPKWCELIASGKKTIEVRKNWPKDFRNGISPIPFKCYIYCTKFHHGYPDSMINLKGRTSFFMPKSGSVIGEFVCDAIYPVSFYASDSSFFDTEPPLPVPGTCLTDRDIAEYLGNGKTGYGWHISDLVIYDEPKKLSEFEIFRTEHITEKAYFQEGVCDEIKHVRVLVPLDRPPQSWCYVEALEHDP